MEVVVTTGPVRHAKLQSNRHHQETNTQFFTGRIPFLSPNQQRQSTEGTGTWLCQIDSDLAAASRVINYKSEYLYTSLNESNINLNP